MINKLVPSLLGKVRIPNETIASVLSTYENCIETEVSEIQKGWRSVLGYESEEFLFVGVQTKTKPPRQCLVLVNKSDSTVLIPTELEGDFQTAANVLALRSDEQMINFYEFCNLEYGFFYKSEPAIQLKIMEDFDKKEIKDIDFEILINSQRSIWWQRWGGKLYVVNSIISSVKNIELLKNKCGKYEPLPYWMRR